jgi:hypothetical protein
MARNPQRLNASSTPGASGTAAAAAAAPRGRTTKRKLATPRKVPARKTVNKSRRKFYNLFFCY